MRYVVLLYLVITQAQAGAYKCVVNGETIFSDKPCAPDAEQIRITPPPAPEANSDAPVFRDGELELLKSHNKRLAIEKRQIMAGMTQDEVRQAWGNPNAINRSGGKSGEREQWVYHRGSDAQYIYFESGKVTGWN